MNTTNYKKRIWYEGESLVADYYRQQWYTIRQLNYTIRGGEIDCIAEKDDRIVFIEVKVINHIDDLQSFITGKKLYYLNKTIQQYLVQHNIDKDPQLDVVFVKHKQIVEIFTNIGVS